jgi:hypothetical protein
VSRTREEIPSGAKSPLRFDGSMNGLKSVPLEFRSAPPGRRCSGQANPGLRPPRHPSDEDLSPGAPERRTSPRAIFVFSLRETGLPIAVIVPALRETGLSIAVIVPALRGSGLLIAIFVFFLREKGLPVVGPFKTPSLGAGR